MRIYLNKMNREKRLLESDFDGIELVIIDKAGQSRWKPGVDIDALPAMLNLLF
jgi:hypothetical protein